MSASADSEYAGFGPYLPAPTRASRASLTARLQSKGLTELQQNSLNFPQPVMLANGRYLAIRENHGLGRVFPF